MKNSNQTEVAITNETSEVKLVPLPTPTDDDLRALRLAYIEAKATYVARKAAGLACEKEREAAKNAKDAFNAASVIAVTRTLTIDDSLFIKVDPNSTKPVNRSLEDLVKDGHPVELATHLSFVITFRQFGISDDTTTNEHIYKAIKALKEKAIKKARPLFLKNDVFGAATVFEMISIALTPVYKIARRKDDALKLRDCKDLVDLQALGKLPQEVLTLYSLMGDYLIAESVNGNKSVNLATLKKIVFKAVIQLKKSEGAGRRVIITQIKSFCERIDVDCLPDNVKSAIIRIKTTKTADFAAKLKALYAAIELSEFQRSKNKPSIPSTGVVNE